MNDSFQMKGGGRFGKLIVLIVVIVFVGIIYICIPKKHSMHNKTSTRVEETDKSQEIANWIQKSVNVGGYTGCKAKSLGNQLVKCELHFPAGTSRGTVIVNTQGIADKFAQMARLAATIHYNGYSGEQKICEFKYDMYSGTVTEVK